MVKNNKFCKLEFLNDFDRNLLEGIRILNFKDFF